MEMEVFEAADKKKEAEEKAEKEGMDEGRDK